MTSHDVMRLCFDEEWKSVGNLRYCDDAGTGAALHCSALRHDMSFTACGDHVFVSAIIICSACMSLILYAHDIYLESDDISSRRVYMS